MALARIPPPTFADRLRRSAWNLTWLLLYRPTPNPLHGWRRFLLRCFGAKIGAGAHPYPSARVWAPWNLVMEDDSCLGNESDCYNVAPVILRRHCIVSQKAYLCTASHDAVDPAFPLTGAPIEIGPHAWVAAAAFIGPGVTLGAGAIAAAQAVVTRDVPAGMVVAGNPAREVSDRGRTARD
jgi:putative colanic acid biosynthesis acetyltransferase WcaF